MAFLAITAAGQSWSGTNGWFVPPVSGINWPDVRYGQFSVSVLGALSNGTVLVLRRRLQAQFSVPPGTPGAAVSVLVIDATFVASRGEDGFSDDFYRANGMFEYDLVCTVFGTGDTVSVELI